MSYKENVIRISVIRQNVVAPDKYNVFFRSVSDQGNRYNKTGTSKVQRRKFPWARTVAKVTKLFTDVIYECS